MKEKSLVCVYQGQALGRYGFGSGHPFGPARLEAFVQAMQQQGLDQQVCQLEAVLAEPSIIERFHTSAYVERVRQLSKIGKGFLDYGDTPAFPGIYEAAAYVVGASMDALSRIQNQSCRRAFIPIGGLHHAQRNAAAGFCVFNDCAITIQTLRDQYHIQRIAYVDIDAHHGDGVFYAFENDPDLLIADLHEDGRYLYPGTGKAEETGRGQAKGTKLNLPLPPYASDQDFLNLWPQVVSRVDNFQPEFILFQSGADGLVGDPITQLNYSSAVHAQASRSLCDLAEKHCQGHILAWGGGGYNPDNLAQAWTAVVRSFLI